MRNGLYFFSFIDFFYTDTEIPGWLNDIDSSISMTYYDNDSNFYIIQCLSGYISFLTLH